MVRKRSGLGKGLDALIPDTPPGEEKPTTPEDGRSVLLEVPLEKIHPNPRQPRVNFDTAELADLAASIREHGILQPLIVTRSEEGDHYTLIAGERRLLAAEQAGLMQVPVILKEASDQDRLELALIENVQRANLSPLETAEAYRQLADEFGLSHQEIAKQVGKNRPTITNTLRLLNLPPSVQSALAEGKISEGHARALLALSSNQAQAAALQTILEKDLNVRQTEELVRKLSGTKVAAKTKAAPAPEVTAIEERLRLSLGTRVKVKHGQKGGTITIHYYSAEELEALLERLAEQG
ncbi:MAG: ParB/RepB/Spo0J family partition protein [Anaerolineales bacterium]|nr:ParB/RepB/Spo0J family partition protein [Anaerolineales bacterium]